MTRYDKLSTLDVLANIIYETDYESNDVCISSPLRIKGECPVEDEDVGKDNCTKCIKAWMMEEIA